MIADYEAAVAARFDALHGRFKPEVAQDDPRLLGIVASLRPLAGQRILDLGCGKGRFARALGDRGAQRGRAGCLWRRCSPARTKRGSIASARRRVGCPSGRRASTPRSPSRSSNTSRPARVDAGLCRGAARAPAGRDVRRGRQERVFVERAASLAAQRGGEVDRPTARPMDVPPPRAGPGALVPARLACGGG